MSALYTYATHTILTRRDSALLWNIVDSFPEDESLQLVAQYHHMYPGDAIPADPEDLPAIPELEPMSDN